LLPNGHYTFYKKEKKNTYSMDLNVVNMIADASNLLSEVQLALFEASSSSIKTVKELATKLLPFTTNLSRTVSQIGVVTGKMEGELKILRSIPAGRTNVSGQESLMEAISELEERKEKSKNIILFNIPESTASTQSQKLKDDVELVTTALQRFEAVRADKVAVSRLGKEMVDKTRPVKVVFSDREEARVVLRNNRLLGDGVRARADMTLKQREQLRTLWKEIEDRREKGEEDLTVRFFESVPRIVKTQKNFPKRGAHRPITRTSVE
jgi:hypothetical protein